MNSKIFILLFNFALFLALIFDCILGDTRIILGLLVIFTLNLGLASAYTFDKAIERQHTHHYEKWLADGSPWFYAAPNEVKYNTKVLYGVNPWLNKIPDWAEKDQYAKKLLLISRYSLYIFLVISVLAALYGYLIENEL